MLGPTSSVEALPGDDARRHSVAHPGPAAPRRGGPPGPYAARSHRVVPVATCRSRPRRCSEGAPLGATRSRARSTSTSSRRAWRGARLIIDKQAPTTVTEAVGDREFRLDDGGFWQVHRAAAATLTAAVQDLIDRDRFDPKRHHLDLYGGVGLLAAAVGDRFGRAPASPASRATRGPPSTRPRTSPSGSAPGRDRPGRALGRPHGVRRVAPPSASGRAGTVVLDPPRSGAGRTSSCRSRPCSPPRSSTSPATRSPSPATSPLRRARLPARRPPGLRPLPPHAPRRDGRALVPVA